MSIDGISNSSLHSDGGVGRVVPGEDPDPLEGIVAPDVHLSTSVDKTQASGEKKAFKYSVGLLAGAAVFAVAMAVVVVALTVLAPGLPQAALLAIAMSGVTLGGFSVLKNGLYWLRAKIAPKMSEKKRLKSAIGIGLGFASLGLTAKVGSGFISSKYAAVLGALGSSAYGKGSQSAAVGLAQFLYVKFACSKEVLMKASIGEELTPEEVRREAKKLHLISRGLSVVGAGIALLGVTLALIGTFAVPGSQVLMLVMLALAPPLLSIGATMALQNLLHSSASRWQAFINSRKGEDLLIDSGVKDLRGHAFPKENDGESPPVTITVDGEEVLLISRQEVKDRLSLTKRQKVLLALSILLLLAGVAITFASGFMGLSSLQLMLITSIGSAAVSSVLPIVTSGLVMAVLKLKSRLAISKLRWREARKRAVLMRAGIPTHRSESYRRLIAQTSKAIRAEVDYIENGKEKSSYLLASIFLLAGLAIILITMIPGVAPLAGGLRSLGGSFLGMAGGFFLQQLVAYLYELFLRIKERRRERRKISEEAKRALRVSISDLVVDFASVYRSFSTLGSNAMDFEDLEFDADDDHNTK